MFMYETKFIDTNNNNAECEALAVVFGEKQIPVAEPDIIIFKSGDDTKVKVGSTVYPTT